MDISALSNLPAVNSAHTAPAEPNPQAPERRELIQAIKAVNAAGVFGQDNELTFVLDRGSRRAVARLVNRQTHEVVQQIPAEYVLRLAEEIKGS
jgi:uncharacterized FlaG/YvyC family protein